MFHFANLTDAQLRVVAIKQSRNAQAAAAILEEIYRRTPKRKPRVRRRNPKNGELL